MLAGSAIYACQSIIPSACHSVDDLSCTLIFRDTLFLLRRMYRPIISSLMFTIQTTSRTETGCGPNISYRLTAHQSITGIGLNKTNDLFQWKLHSKKNVWQVFDLNANFAQKLRTKSIPNVEGFRLMFQHLK
jgi:hypothetical protein